MKSNQKEYIKIYNKTTNRKMNHLQRKRNESRHKATENTSIGKDTIHHQMIKKIAGIFFDIEKAFDKINKNKTFEQIEKMGIQGRMNEARTNDHRSRRPRHYQLCY